MDWKQMWENTVAMLTPDWFEVRVTGYIVFGVFVPVTALIYIFTALIFG
jgi:hypothetical protein